MKILKQFKLEKVASTDDTRPSIQNILVAKEGDGAVAVATNGRSMAIVSVEIEADHELGLLSPDALKFARKQEKRAVESVMVLNGDIRLLDGVILPRPTEDEAGRYPNWKQVGFDGPVAFTVGLDAKLLLDLAEAIGATNNNGALLIKLEFKDEMSPIRVTTAQHPGATGILMPARVS